MPFRNVRNPFTLYFNCEVVFWEYEENGIQSNPGYSIPCGHEYLKDVGGSSWQVAL